MDEKKDLEMMELRLKVSKSFFVLATFIFLLSYFFVASGFYKEIFIYVLKYSYFVFITSLFLVFFLFFRIYTKNTTFYAISFILLLFYIASALVFLFPKNLFL
jgi:hypothetical protein